MTKEIVLKIIDVENDKIYDYEYDDLDEAMENAFLKHFDSDDVYVECIMTDDSYYTLEDMKEYWIEKGWMFRDDTYGI